jgi:hypothetical protein
MIRKITVEIVYDEDFPDCSTLPSDIEEWLWGKVGVIVENVTRPTPVKIVPVEEGA